MTGVRLTRAKNKQTWLCCWFIELSVPPPTAVAELHARCEGPTRYTALFPSASTHRYQTVCPLKANNLCFYPPPHWLTRAVLLPGHAMLKTAPSYSLVVHVPSLQGSSKQPPPHPCHYRPPSTAAPRGVSVPGHAFFPHFPS